MSPDSSQPTVMDPDTSPAGKKFKNIARNLPGIFNKLLAGPGVFGNRGKTLSRASFDTDCDDPDCGDEEHVDTHYATTRLAISADNPFAIMFVMAQSPLDMIVIEFIRCISIIVNSLLIWWLVNNSQELFPLQGESSRPETDIKFRLFFTYNGDRTLATWIRDGAAITLVSMSLFLPSLSTTLESWKRFCRVCKFTSNIGSCYKWKLRSAAFFCFIVDQIFCPIFAFTLSMFVALFHSGDSNAPWRFAN